MREEAFVFVAIPLQEPPAHGDLLLVVDVRADALLAFIAFPEFVEEHARLLALRLRL